MRFSVRRRHGDQDADFPDFECTDPMNHGDVFYTPSFADFSADFPHLGFGHLGIGLIFQPQRPPAIRIVPHGYRRR